MDGEGEEEREGEEAQCPRGQRTSQAGRRADTVTVQRLLPGAQVAGFWVSGQPSDDWARAADWSFD